MNDFDNKQICSYKDIDRFGFTCDVCGRKVNGCHYINGMSFCEKCYQETFGKDNQQNEIQQLKQQLAEKNIRIEELESQFAYECECNMQLVDLQKQLEEKQNTIDETNKNFVQAVHDWKTLCAEKDKEIERLKVFEKAYYFNQTQVSQESMDLLLQNAYQVHNETRLAIQELEKVKILLQNAVNYEGYTFVGLYDAVNNQIKELKGE